MPDEGILKAEQRVREMNRMTQQYAEQGSRYMQNIQNMQNMRRRNSNQPQSTTVPDQGTRFEPVPVPQDSSGQVAEPPQAVSSIGRSSRSRQSGSPVRGAANHQNDSRDKNSRGMQNMHNPQGQRNKRQPQWLPAPPAPAPPIPEPEPQYEPPREEFQPAPQPPRETQEKDPSPVSDIFSGLGIDSEQLLLLALMYLLIREKADFKLILALGYLIL